MEVVEVNIDVVIPKDNVGFVLMHSDISGISDIEPYQWKPECIERQISKIERALAIAKSSDHAAERTSFVLLPEYSVPGPIGVARIDSVIRGADWPANTIVIGGLDNLNHADYSTLCAYQNITVVSGSLPSEIDNGKYVNCFVLWAKEQDGTVRMFIQTKMDPAWLERTTKFSQMHLGEAAFLFKCKFEGGIACRFFSLICFDWIGKDSSSTPIWKSILSVLNQRYPENPIDLNWIFVLQENRKPNDPSFLSVTRELFEERTQYPSISRDNCAVVFVNNAESEKLGDSLTHGFSSIIYSTNIAAMRIEGSPPTYSGSPTITRDTEILRACVDVVLREKGACIHSLSMKPPKFLDAGITAKCLPLTVANVHSIDGNEVDPRARGKQVPGIIKWFNDKVEEIKPLAQRVAANLPANKTNDIYLKRAKEMANQEGRLLLKKMIYGSSHSTKNSLTDRWKLNEISSLKVILDTIGILSLAVTTDVDTEDAHAIISVNNESMNVVIIFGDTHTENQVHIDSLTLPPRETFLVVSKDSENTVMTDKERNFTQMPSYGNELERKITVPSSKKIRIEFSKILNAYRSATDEIDLRNRIHDILRSE